MSRSGDPSRQENPPSPAGAAKKLLLPPSAGFVTGLARLWLLHGAFVPPEHLLGGALPVLRRRREEAQAGRERQRLLSFRAHRQTRPRSLRRCAWRGVAIQLPWRVSSWSPAHPPPSYCLSGTPGPEERAWRRGQTCLSQRCGRKIARETRPAGREGAGRRDPGDSSPPTMEVGKMVRLGAWPRRRAFCTGPRGLVAMERWHMAFELALPVQVGDLGMLSLAGHRQKL